MKVDTNRDGDEGDDALVAGLPVTAKGESQPSPSSKAVQPLQATQAPATTNSGTKAQSTTSVCGCTHSSLVYDRKAADELDRKVTAVLARARATEAQPCDDEDEEPTAEGGGVGAGVDSMQVGGDGRKRRAWSMVPGSRLKQAINESNVGLLLGGPSTRRREMRWLFGGNGCSDDREDL